MNLDSLSDDELEQLASGKMPKKTQSMNLDDLSDDELQQLAGEKPLESPGLIERTVRSAVGGIVKAGEVVDSYTGAPTRSAIGAVQSGENPLSAYIKQFGRDPSLAPSGREISVKAGASEEPLFKSNVGQLLRSLPGPFGSVVKMGSAFLPRSIQESEVAPSAAGLSGLAIDVGADPTNVIPIGAMAKGLGRGTKFAYKEGAVPLAKTVGELSARGIRTVPGGSTALKIGEVGLETTRSIKDALGRVFKPTQAMDFKEMSDIAVKNGIDPALLPESVEFGDTTFISRGSRHLREGPLGEPDFKKFVEGHKAVQDAFTNKIKTLSPAPLDEISAGQAIRTGYDNAVDRLFKDVDFTYNSVIDQAPGIKLSPDSARRLDSKLRGVEKEAKGRVLRGITKTEKEQGQQVLNAVAAIRAGNGSLKQTYEAMSEIGKHAFKKGQNTLADIPIDQKKFQDLYHAMRGEFLETTAEYLGKDVAQKLVDSNQLITDFNKSKDVISGLIGNPKMADERLFQTLILNGDSKRINALKDILSPEELNQLKGSVLENLVKRDADGNFSFGTLHSAMRNRRNVLESLFTPQEIVEFGEIVKLGDRFGPAVLSTSGTGATNVFRDLAKGISEGAVTRSVLEGMKDSARGRGAIGAATSTLPPTVAPSIQGRGGFQRPVRGSLEEKAKLLQIMGAAGISSDKEEKTAAKRRMQELINKRLGQ